MNEEMFLTWKIKVEPVLESKADEWRMLGYERASKEDVWNIFIARLPRIEVPERIRFHWIVAEIFHLKTHDYMNWLTISAYKAPNWFENEEPVNFRLNNLKTSEDE